MLCPNCKKWEILEVDLFCSWCKFKVADFELALDASQFYVGDVAETLTLTIKHTGSVGAVELKMPESNQPWLKIKTDDLIDFNLRSGKVITLPVEIDPMLLADDYHEAEIKVDSKIGPRVISVEVVPRPEIKVFTGEYTILLDLLQEESNTGHIEVTRGVVTVERLSTNVPWARVELINNASYPFKLDARYNRRLDFAFVIDEAYLINEIEMSRKEPPVEFKGNLVIDYVELKPAREESFRANCFLPPKLMIPEEAEEGTIAIGVFKGKRGEVWLTLQNGETDQKGRADLKILDIGKDAPWLRPTAPIGYPMTISSGQYKQIGFTVLTDEMEEDTHVAKIRVFTSLPAEESQKDLYIAVTVGQMEDFDGFLAIDFGTTNSCCAAWDEWAGQIKQIEIDNPQDNEKPTTAPSAILYRNLLDDGTKDFIIGNRAYEYSMQPKTESSTVVQIKRKLGRSEPIPISFFNDPAKRASYLPKQITADIIHRIIEHAEDYLKRRITRCTISHPSRFSMRQIEDLKFALIKSNIKEKDINTIHEPIGAALDFIKTGKDIWEKYKELHLMVFDFGGGTTDITLLRLNNHYNEAHDLYEVSPKVLGANGNNWLGGEDVTTMVTDIALEKCHKALRDIDYPDATNIVIPFDAKSFTDPRRRELARDNRRDLRRWAEATKISLSDSGDDYLKESREVRLYLNVIIDNVMERKGFESRYVVPLITELNDKLKPKLAEVIEMMKRLARNNKIQTPDIILLSGKSSALPVVEEIINEHFPDSRIHRPKDLKECVVQGACLLSLTDPVQKVAIIMNGNGSLSATTSRLGIRVSETGTLKFQELVDAGVPITPPSLKGPVKIGPLKRNMRIRILENTGLEDEFILNGQENKNINTLKVFSLEHALADWEREHNTFVTDDDLSRANVEFEVTTNLMLILKASIPGIDTPLEFQSDAMGN